MSVESIVWHAEFFKRHTKVWRELSTDITKIATVASEAKPHEGSMSWPHLAELKTSFDAVHRSYSSEFLNTSAAVFGDIATRLDRSLRQYIDAETENNAEIRAKIYRELEQ